MRKKMQIPPEVTSAIMDHVCDKGEVVFLGKAEDAEYYIFEYSEELETGFPVVCRWKDESASILESREGLRIISRFCKE